MRCFQFFILHYKVVFHIKVLIKQKKYYQVKNKLKLFSALFILLLFSCSPQQFTQKQKFEFHGQVKGIDKGIVELLVEPFTDSNFVFIKNKKVELRNGIFKIKGKIAYPYQTRIIINDSLYSKVFYLESGKIEGNFLLDSIGSLSNKVISKLNEEYVANYIPNSKFVISSLEDWYSIHWTQQKYYPNGIPSSIEDSMQILKSNFIRKLDTINYNYISQNNKSFIGFWALVNSFGIYNSLRYKSFHSLDKKLQTTYTGKKIASLLENGKKVQLGEVFPDIYVLDTLGIQISLKSKFSAKYTLIDFWFSYCGPCIAQFPKLKELNSSFALKDFKILGISVDQRENKLSWLNAVHKYKLPWPHYWDIDGTEATQLGITGYPQNYLINQKREIVAINLEINQIESFLKANLK